MRLAVLLLALLVGTSAGAQHRPGAPSAPLLDLSSRERIAAANVGLTALFAVARGVAEGRVRTVWDGAEVAAGGALAGAGFYLAKDAVGRGHGVLGVGLAFASASLAENVSGGGGALGHVRAGFGPVDLRLRTPLATDASGSVLAVELDPVGAVAAVALPLTGARPAVRGGVLVYVQPGLAEPGSAGRTLGTTVGRVVVVADADDGLPVRHETIHLVQAVQAGAVTPYGTAGALSGGRVTSHGGAVRWDLRADWLTAALGGLSAALADGPEDGWPEFEAYELDEPPPPRYEGPPCLALPPGAFCNLRGGSAP